MKLNTLLEAKKTPTWEDDLAYKPNLWGHRELEKALDEVLKELGARTNGMKRSTIWIKLSKGGRTEEEKQKFSKLMYGGKLSKVLKKFNMTVDDLEDFDWAWKEPRHGGFKILIKRLDPNKPIKSGI